MAKLDGPLSAPDKASFYAGAMTATRECAIALRSSPLARTGMDYMEKVQLMSPWQLATYDLYLELVNQLGFNEKSALIDLFWETLLMKEPNESQVTT